MASTVTENLNDIAAPSDVTSTIVEQAPPSTTTSQMEASPADRPSALPIPPFLFDEDKYLVCNADIAAEVQAGGTTAYAHYLANGHADELAGRQPRLIPKAVAGLEAYRDRQHESLIDRIVALETERRTLLDAWEQHRETRGAITFDMLSEQPDQLLIPMLDRVECDERGLDDDQRFWRDNGYIIKTDLIPHELLDRYAEIRARNPNPGGWTCFAPYMHVAELRDVGLHPPLMKLMEKLIGEEMGMMLNLTGWVSTDRNFHQDDYLNPGFVHSWYAAVWIALDDIHPDCGPFEFVPGSHKWDELRGSRVRLYLSAEERADPAWPAKTERFLNDVVEDEIRKRDLKTTKFIAKKGDVLIWHGRLMHRGSYANQPGMIRKSLICHYMGLSHSIDAPNYTRTADGSAYFTHDVALDFDPYNVQVAQAAE